MSLASLLDIQDSCLCDTNLSVEGELPEDGLAAYGDDGDDLMLVLARKIVNGEEGDAEMVEAVFAQARDAEAAGEEYLVDDGWKALEVEPEVVEVNGNDIGPSFELVLGGNGHDETPETQQSLFSRAEFLAKEPVKRKGRSRSPLPRPCSSGRSPWSRSGRRSWSVQGADDPLTYVIIPQN